MVSRYNIVGISAVIFILTSLSLGIIPESVKETTLFSWTYAIVWIGLFLNMCFQGYRFDSYMRRSK